MLRPVPRLEVRRVDGGPGLAVESFAVGGRGLHVGLRSWVDVGSGGVAVVLRRLKTLLNFQDVIKCYREVLTIFKVLPAMLP